jgi:hypothetical protein
MKEYEVEIVGGEPKVPQPIQVLRNIKIGNGQQLMI